MCSLAEIFLVLTFSVLDLFCFCVFFESVLLPMVFIIYNYGIREQRRIKALTYFFMYTLLGSVCLLLAIFSIFCEAGSAGYFDTLLFYLPISKEWFVWLLLFLVFAIKVPVFPFHIWLPEAHVEAPTVGSVILAGLLIKIGRLRSYSFFIYVKSCASFLSTLSLRFMSYKCLYCLYYYFTSVGFKTNYCLFFNCTYEFCFNWFFLNSIYGLIGGMLLMISHGIVSSALFLLVGMLYDRYHTRSVLYYGGLATTMPLFVTCLFLFMISNFSFPGTSNFVGELLVFVAIGETANRLILIILALTTILILVSTMFVFNRIAFGSIKLQYTSLFYDLTRREFALLFPLLLLNFIMGLFPNGIAQTVYFSLKAALGPILMFFMSFEIMCYCFFILLIVVLGFYLTRFID